MTDPEQRDARWILDCWQPGCGWSRVGWETEALHAQWELHVQASHPELLDVQAVPS